MQVASLSLDIQHTQQNKSNRHLEQRRKEIRPGQPLYWWRSRRVFAAGLAGRRDYTRSSDQRAGSQKPNRIKNWSSTPLPPLPQSGWRVVHPSPQIQRSLPPVPPPSSAVGGARPPVLFGWVFGFLLTTQTFSCAGWVCVS